MVGVQRARQLPELLLAKVLNDKHIESISILPPLFLLVGGFRAGYDSGLSGRGEEFFGRAGRQAGEKR